jgi:hypothetical protein
VTNPDHITVERLGELIRRLDSDWPGEVAATLAAVRDILAVNRMNFNDLANWIERDAYNKGFRDGQGMSFLDDEEKDDVDEEESYDARWNLTARQCLESADWLNRWELSFVKSMATWPKKPSDKQARQLDRIFSDLKERERVHARRPFAI